MTYVNGVTAAEADMRGMDPFDLLAALKPAWHADALCREYPDVSFFPERNSPAGPARAVCGHCLVAAECLSWALDQEGWLPGVWGGTTPADRRALRRKLRTAA